MKVALWPSFNPKENGEGGIRRVWEALNKHLPSYGVELVQNIEESDVVNVHADWIQTDKPVAYSSHGLYWAGYDWPKWAIEANARLIHATRYAHALSVPSQFVHNAFARGALLNPFVLYHGIELEEWEPSENMGYVFWGKTRIDPICDPQPVNELAKRCPEIGFVSTFGDQTLPNMHITGHLTYQRSKALLKSADAYLATVKETGGITVLEALASGIPALGFSWGVNPEIIIHKETGYLVPPGDYDALREGLYYIREHRDRLGANAREYVRQHHQWKDRIGSYISFYRAALDGVKQHGPSVSIIVTAYKLADYLPACLDSILRQDFSDWECIIVNDASPDECGNIANEYARKDKRFKVIHNQTNLYLAEARNIGISHSQGRYILPLDADDEVGEGTLRVLSEALDKDNTIDIVTGSFQLIEPDGTRWLSTWPPERPNYNDQIRFHNQVPYASMYRRWVWERTGGYRRRWRSAEDAEFWTRAMSFGAVPSKVTNKPTLVYNNRPNSMSHTIQTPNWTAWFPWSYYPKVTPFTASGEPPKDMDAYPVLDYDPVEVTVVIPCGPGHDVYLQDALDSLVAQTYQNWRVIVVNDTGKKWFDSDGKCINSYIRGYPFAKFLDCENEGVSVGPARTRNRGIAKVHSPYFLLLDADDYLQPLGLYYIMGIAKTRKDCWIYTDFLDQEGNYKESKNFDWDDALIKMPGPITGLYRTSDWHLVGGFDEKIKYWEDYSFLLSLMEIGRCGIRLKHPAFTYRYDRGTRREWTHEHASEALIEIRTKHHDLIELNKCKEIGSL